MKFNKQKITEIFLTALIGALIAFFQSLLVPIEQISVVDTNTIFAGIWSGVIRAFRTC